MVTPAGVKTFIGGRELIRMAFLKKGINEDSVDIMINSITVSTLKQYQAHLKLWWDFASVNSINMFQADTPAIISFLTKRFKEGASYGTLNSTRSAISLISLRDISSDVLISRFFKGIFKQKPTKPKYSSIWDTAPVLNYLENINPLNQFKAKEVAEKTATLLALATAHRLQTLALIKTDNILISSTGITIKIPDLIKTSKLSNFQPELILPFFREKPSLCAASVVIEYLDYTKDLRSNNNKRLLISTVKPHGDATAQTIAH
ncbi:uncharacterized protein LOC115246130 [Formica exsecta]|uniref:uncharacterized protein LOC115246130 n=1 Tax=Formica exsecta TaxID=72781 RepID=UPI00114396B4|nr:uncharacterized protein LOC115246130 [Formica exsecta]